MDRRAQGLTGYLCGLIGLALLGIAEPASAATVINNLMVTGSTCASSAGPYVVQQAGFVTGATQFIDRTFKINGTVPGTLNGQTFIQTCNSDKNLSPGATSVVSFSVGQDSRVYVLHDPTATPTPGWLTSQFTDLGQQITNDNSHTFEVFVSNTTYKNGSTVTLGSNVQSASGTSYSMYSIVVIPSAGPGGLSTVCATAVVVGLQWAPVTSAASYSLSRNGTSLATRIPVTYYNDQTVAANTNYSYTLTAVSSNGTVVSTQTASVKTAAASPNGDPAYCPSATIPAMTVNWSAGINQQNGSDLWSQTQGSDGHEYGFFGDGGGFGGSNSVGRVSWGIGEITSATPGSLSGAVNVYGGASQQHPASISGKATSLLAVGTSFYAIGGVTSTTNNGISGGANDQEIVFSNGNAWTWTDNAPNWTFCTTTSSSTGFCPGAFLQNGPGYSGNTDGFVYIYGGTANDFFGNGTPGLARDYLWRVKSNAILDNTAYQAFSGLDASGNPKWTTGSFATLSSAMTPIFTDRGPRPLGLSSVVYNSALNRYIASAEGAVNQVAFYEAPNPWGPWASIGYFNSNAADNSGGWGNLGAGITWASGHGDGLGINFLTNWTSSDGKTLWIVFSSDGTASTSANLVSLRGKDMDSFSAVPITLTTH